MADLTTVNPQITDTIKVSQQATMSSTVVKVSGAGKAYQSVAQSAAIAVQDATDNLRNISTISTTALGVAMAQLLATGDTKYVEAITTAQSMMSRATSDFTNIGEAAAAIANKFPTS